ncbi:MAG: YggS family pyridoxal phosphate-dependent enzyme [Candidatus Dormibacteria bacterium]
MAVALAAVRERIARAAETAGRDPSSVLLIAVTKGATADRVDAAIAAGATDLGENRVQEAESKRAQLGGAARWHLIGHLQTNKAQRAASLFDMVQSVDSTRVAVALAAGLAAGREPLDVLIEVDLTAIAGRTGAPEAAVAELAHEIAQRVALRLRGLMTIAAPATDPRDAASTFRRLRSLRDDLEQRLGTALPELSMGMSDDFEVAIAEGATMVRLGRAVFGERA